MTALPDWPRFMRRASAASYADYSRPEFDRAVAAGELPDPVHTTAGERWDRRAIDAALDRLSGNAVAVDWRAEMRARDGMAA
jgi:predicted DNA-binding transcriptional regulator AlpA